MALAIHWFRQDLRVADNPALAAAAKHGRVLPIYILEELPDGAPSPGAASRWWLHHSLAALNKALGGALSFYRGNPAAILAGLIARYDVQAVCWTRCYEPWRIARDKGLKAELRAKGVQVETHNGSLLWEPWTIKKPDGAPYKVFTPFYRKGCLQTDAPRAPLPAPPVDGFQDKTGAQSLQQLGLASADWDKRLAPHWQIGEDAAHQRFQHFLQEGLPHYKDGRNFPAQPHVSRLSPHLHFGEISPHHLWHAVRAIAPDREGAHFCSELGWREFSYYLLFHNPDLPTKNLQPQFDHFPWAEDDAALVAWQKGQTGIPMVDAGMRELRATGYMHNRVRMIAGSFLVKNLRLDWRHGERWFWQHLVDADLANNSASWQWVAGCGADAAPYFRIFNPVVQGQKFDPDGAYVRRFVPELAALPNKYLFSPWEAPAQVLRQANIQLGATYPHPIVDLQISRQKALDALRFMKEQI